MAPLYTDKLINYFKDIDKELKNRSKPKYDDYVFPVEITAEYVADKFGVSRTAVLKKLKEMEKDNIIVSKKGNVEGKPRKRLVFFFKEEIFKTYTEKINKSSVYPEFKVSTRELLYERYNRIIEIEANGDCQVTMEFIIRNISNMDIIEIPLPKIRFDTYEAVNMFDRLSRIVVDGNVLPYSSDGLRYYKKSVLGQLDPAIESPISDYHSEVVYVIPLEKGIKPGDTISIQLNTHLPAIFSNLYEFEYAGFMIHEITMSASIIIIAPRNHTIKLLKRYQNSSYKRGLIIKDVNSEMRKVELEEKAERPRVSKRQISWTIEKPVIGCRYIIPFIVIKNEK